jgi:hypothetical protein
MSIPRFSLFIVCSVSYLASYSQDADSLQLIEKLPSKYYSLIDKKMSNANERLTRKSLKYLAKFQRQERKLQQKLQKLNPELAVANANEKYNELSQKIKSKTTGVSKIVGGEYDPYMDSLGTSLSFLKQYGIGDKVTKPLQSFDLLQSKLQESEKIKAFIAERKNQLKELLSKYTKLPGSLKSEYDKLSKTAYYYSAQVKEYKDLLKDPKKIEQKALALLNKVPAFQKFMKENGQLASLFRINENLDPAQRLAGLQTRSSVQGVIQQRIASGGPNAMQIVQQNLAAAHAELNKLKDKINQLGGGGSDVDIPDFKPNDQKTKPFLKRLEYSTNVQFEKSNKLLPSAANIGLGIGYKLNDKIVTGVGLSYKVGIGTIQHLSFTSQGIGLRSYLDWKIKKQFYVSSGYEMNYYPAYEKISQVSPAGGDLEGAAWQRSALIGVSKRYKVSKKVNGEIKLLYDFLANTHIPVSQAFVFRIGYKF